MTAEREPNKVDDAMTLLQEGNTRYMGDCCEHPLLNASRRGMTTKEQHPWAIVLTCADSRVSPEMVFDCGIGELFVVRVAGNTANTCSIASIEYAVLVLGVKLIVVLGHENCGAVKAALGGTSVSYNVDQLLGHLTPVAAEYGSKWQAETDAEKKDAIQDQAAGHNADHVARHLLEQSSIIAGAQGLTVMPAVYSTATGQVNWRAALTV